MVFFEIYGEQKTLTQWDLGRRMQVNLPCQQLHYANEGVTEAFVCPVQEEGGIRTARIPDEVLRVSGTLWVYAYVEEEEGYTKQTASFFVKARPKPADYVYTPTEWVTMEELAERIGVLEAKEESDPTVYGWAKQPQKPAYNAQEVGARANTWLPSLTEIGAAPAGYGLGENLPADIDHLDLANRIGWFRSNQEVVSFGLTPGWWFGNYIPYGDNEGVWELNHYLDGLKANIRKVNGVLQPAEWVNPPMVAGVEYRTTERYMGKPVYVRAVDCGNIPNATYKIITYGEENCVAIFVYGATNYVGTVPSMNVGSSMGLGFNSDQVISLWGNRNTISIACGGDRSSASLVCVVKYYKTTD